jgi:hypothetical protein
MKRIETAKMRFHTTEAGYGLVDKQQQQTAIT